MLIDDQAKYLPGLKVVHLTRHQWTPGTRLYEVVSLYDARRGEFTIERIYFRDGTWLGLDIYKPPRGKTVLDLAPAPSEL